MRAYVSSTRGGQGHGVGIGDSKYLLGKINGAILPGRGLMTTGILLGKRSLGTDGEFRESLALHRLFFMYLQLKIISIQKWRILGWHVLNSYSCILEQHILLFSGIYILTTNSHCLRAVPGVDKKK